MRYFLLLLLFCTTSTLSAQDVDVWAPDEISSRGAVRMSELFRTLGPLNSWSSERYSLRFQGIGLGGSHASGPTVSIDGVDMPFRYMDRELYEMLPISPADIDSISYDASWTTLTTGQQSDGILRITTKRPEGFSIRGSVGFTNETGDPGPEIYLNPTLRNVDRSGPTSAVRISLRRAGWYVQAGINTDAYHVTDELVARRVWKVFDGSIKPVTTSTSPHVRVAFKNQKYNLDLWAGRSLRKDFLYDEIAGWEWPSQQDWKWMSMRASKQISSFYRIGVSSNAKTLRTNSSAATIDLPNSMLTQDFSGETFLERNAPLIQFKWSIGARITEQVQDRGSGTGKNRRVFSNISSRFIPATGTEISVDGFTASPLNHGLNSGNISSFLSGRLNRARNSGGRITLAASYRSNHEADVWSTLDHIYNGMKFDDWSGLISISSVKARTQALDITFRSIFPLSKSVFAWVGLQGRQWMGLTLPERQFQYRPGSNLFRSDTDYHTGRSGRVLIPSGGLLLKPSPATTIRLGYHYVLVIPNGDLLFWQQFTGLSPQRFTGSIQSTATERLHIFASFELASPRQWPEYSQYWQSKRPWVANVEATILKDLWRENLRLGLSLLNVANTPNQNHPAGVIEQLAVRFSIVARFSDVQTESGISK